MKLTFRGLAARLSGQKSIFQGCVRALAAGLLLTSSCAMTLWGQIAPTGSGPDASVPVVAAAAGETGQASQSMSFVLNRDESVDFLQSATIGAEQGCPALTANGFEAGLGQQQNLIYDPLANHLYIMSPASDGNPGIVVETPNSNGNCNPSPVVELSGSINYAKSMAVDSAVGNLYVVQATDGGTEDALFVLNSSSFSGSNAPPFYTLDYSGVYGQTVVDTSTHLVYVPELEQGYGGTGSGPGFWVFNPSLNMAVRVLGFVDPTSHNQVNVNAVALFVAGNGKLVIVNANPNPSGSPEADALIELDTTRLCFFATSSCTTPILQGGGFPSGIYAEPTGGVVYYPTTATYSSISAADFDAATQMVYVTAYNENSSNVIAQQGDLLSYNLMTNAETLYASNVPQPTTFSSSTYAGWGQLVYDAYANELLLFNSNFEGTGSAMISTALGGAGSLSGTGALSAIAATNFNPTGVVVNESSGYIYMPSVNGANTSSPTSPAIYYIAPSGGSTGAAQVTLALDNVPSTAVAESTFTVNAVFESSGTGTPAGDIGIVAQTGESPQQVAEVAASTALAAGSAGTPVQVTINSAGSYTLSSSYAGNSSFAGASSPLYNLQVTGTDSLSLSLPATAVAGTAFTVNVSMGAVGGVPTGSIAVLASLNGGSAQPVGTVSTSTAFAAGASGTPVVVTLNSPGPYVISASYAGVGLFPAATSANYNLSVSSQTAAKTGLAILIPGLISSQDGDEGTAGSVPSATAFDSTGNFYVLDSGLGSVTEYPVGGSATVIVPQTGGAVTLSSPGDMIAESSGTSLLISDYGNNRLVRVGLGSSITVTPLTLTGVPAASAPCQNVVAGTSLCNPSGLAEDSQGDIYVSDTGNGRVLKLNSQGTFMVTMLSAGSSPLVIPLGLALDGSGNLYVANSSGTSAAGSIVRITAQDNVENISESGIVQPYGLAVDPAGDLYFSDTKDLTVSVLTGGGDLYTVAGDGASADGGDGGAATGAGIAYPLGVTLDANADLFIGDSVQSPANGGEIREVAATQGVLNFGSVTESVTSPPLQVTVLNGGTASLTISSSTISGTNSADFTLTDNCANQVGLDPAVTCPLTVAFTPSTTAAESATLTITDNSGGAAGATQTVKLIGTGEQSQSAAASPTFNPPAGTYALAQSVAISSTTGGAKIYYTTDGSIPPGSSTSVLYSTPVAVNASETLTAVATATGLANSAVATANYVIGVTPMAAAPTFSVPAGSYTTAQTVTLSSTTPNASIYYTINGVPPAALYGMPLTVANSETIDAYATAPGYTQSSLASASYSINASFTMLGSYKGSTPATTIVQTLDAYDKPYMATVTLTLIANNGYNLPVTLSDTFNGTSSSVGGNYYGFCSDPTGVYQASCTVTPTAAGTIVYYTFSLTAPETQRSAGGMRSHSKGRLAKKLAGASSFGLLGSVVTLVLFGLFWRRHGLYKAVVCICLCCATVSMGILLAGCNDTGSYQILATPPDNQGVQAVYVTINYDGNK